MNLKRCFIGLGSNLGDSRAILQQAIQALSELGTVKVSALYASPPMGPQDQPDYLNAAVELNTDLTPLALLDQLQHIENESGRVRLRRWGERTLDLDLLFYANEKIKNERLTVPHIGIAERDFVVLPLLDLADDLILADQRLQDLACVQQPTARCIADPKWYLTELA